VLAGSVASAADYAIVVSTQTRALPAWADYPLGVVACYQKAGHATGSLAIAFDASLPAGAGLSSSAAFEAATALIVEQMLGISLPPRERALLCQQAKQITRTGAVAWWSPGNE